MNKVILKGRLTSNPEVRYTDGGMAIARFHLAIDRRKTKDNQDPGADFPSCVAFGKTAEVIEKHTAKGAMILVEGRLQTGSYTGQDGVKRYTTEVILDSFEFCEKKEGAPAPADGFMNIPEGLEEELPFN